MIGLCSFFAGHSYQTCGVYVQPTCDHNCKFSFLCIAGPSVFGDWETISQIPNGRLVGRGTSRLVLYKELVIVPTHLQSILFRFFAAKRK
jgi:hypothetical protein